MKSTFLPTFSLFPVDINTANVKKLQSLNGISSKTAKIINQNKINKGFFKSVQSLCRIPGMRKKFLERLLHNNKNKITAEVYL